MNSVIGFMTDLQQTDSYARRPRIITQLLLLLMMTMMVMVMVTVVVGVVTVVVVMEVEMMDKD